MFKTSVGSSWLLEVVRPQAAWATAYSSQAPYNANPKGSHPGKAAQRSSRPRTVAQGRCRAGAHTLCSLPPGACPQSRRAPFKPTARRLAPLTAARGAQRRAEPPTAAHGRWQQLNAECRRLMPISYVQARAPPPGPRAGHSTQNGRASTSQRNNHKKDKSYHPNRPYCAQ